MDTALSSSDIAATITLMIISSSRPAAISRQEQIALAQQALQRQASGASALRIGIGLLMSAVIILGLSLALALAGPLISGLVCALAIAGLFNILTGVRRLRYQRQLATAAAITHAPIIDCWIEQQFDGEPGVIAWELSVVTPSGTPARLRQAQFIDPAQIAIWQQRSTVTIRYLPANPAVSRLAE